MQGLALLLLATTTVMSGKAPAPPMNGGIVEREPDRERSQPKRSSSRDGIDRSPTISKDLDDIDRQIKNDRKSGVMTKAEARSYRRDAYMIKTLAVRYGQDGLSEAEATELKSRSDALRSLVSAPQQKGRPKRP